MHIPYTYRITHIPSGKHYYGARYAAECHPSDLFVTYFTSSKVVARLIEQDGVDAFFCEIRKVFIIPQDCTTWERKVLSRLKVVTSNNWLNLVVSYIPVSDELRKIYIAKYGVANPQWLPKVAAKRRQTCLERYGSHHPCGSAVVRQKICSTNQSRYGVDSTLSLPEVQELIRKTRYERYGADHHFANKDIQAKIAETNMRRYGVVNVLSDLKFRQKAKDTILEKYGVHHVMHDNEIATKAKETWVNQFSKGSPRYEELRKRTEATNFDKYGSEHYFNTEEFKDKSKQTIMQRYGCENPTQNPDVASRISITKQNAPMLTCSKCGFESNNPAVMSNYHMNNCKWLSIVCVELGKVLYTRVELMKFLHGFNLLAKYQAVYNVCEGTTKSAYGYHWKYLNEKL
jgi:hypothetical protein